jgi:hypothetical protein
MGVDNVLKLTMVCPLCRVKANVKAGFRAGLRDGSEYHIGDRLRWEGQELGLPEQRPKGGNVDSVAYATCLRCERDFWLIVSIRSDVIVGAQVATTKEVRIADGPLPVMPMPPVPELGAKIELLTDMLQPKDVFTPDTYYRFLASVRQKRHERRELGDLISNKYETPRERLDSREYEQLQVMEWELVQLSREYTRRLPIHLFARCPYCGMHILQPLDSFSLLGLAPGFDTRKLYYKYQWVESPRPRQRCRHALLATVALNLYGRRPDDLPAWALTTEWKDLDVGPCLMVWPLVARRTSAVVHALPIGRLDDPEPIHRYTAYVVTYFFDDGSNLGSEEMWVPNSGGGPAMGAVQIDPDLVKWLRAGRLYWLNPASPSELLSGPEEAFPYAGIRPQGWYTIVAGGHLYGPRPYASMWQGQPPPHDESFPRSVEPLEG